MAFQKRRLSRVTTQSLESQSEIIYFDNSATSFPKPNEVVEVISKSLREFSANPGRAGHKLSMRAGSEIFKTRLNLASFFGVSNPMAVVFDLNATALLNLAIKGFAYKGLHVITTSLEHNSTIRPLMRLKNDGIINLSITSGDEDGIVGLKEIESLKNSNTKLLVINHTSNVTGSTQPIREICKWCRENGIVTIVDASQSAGFEKIDLKEDFIDILCFTGHKGLYSPMGVGGMVLADEFDLTLLKPLKEGGTGSLSEEIVQPDFLPDIFESGTPPLPMIAGLNEGLEFVKRNYESITKKKIELESYFIKRAKKIEGVELFYGNVRNGVISFRVKGVSVSKITEILSEDYGIMSRQGLHCAPLAHKKLGTFPEGLVRFSFGYSNEIWQIDKAIEAIEDIERIESE